MALQYILLVLLTKEIIFLMWFVERKRFFRKPILKNYASKSDGNAIRSLGIFGFQGFFFAFSGVYTFRKKSFLFGFRPGSPVFFGRQMGGKKE